MKNRKAKHSASELSTLAQRAVRSAKARRASALSNAELEAATGGLSVRDAVILIGGYLVGNTQK
jgi:hypothetical protein